ncbi:type II toxin-antitoxin system death-on-curing family toxin [Halobacteria archaeon AArc-m2/3/4]|uniref:Type II toxin-antitoxin system death-on-curing family toxin n=1 Tax=Natronoglomus mannanivorans TaxID=2979990 RepID=A0AAP2YZF9_9EURY|nr:type II toxin-antitoxin system death-on-curing family toxin [Halobacteria archaeon AArc-xg1-1]MCU4975396.1 type II toxin-antitoxin system death-on-curing family toxin [Halobacteria archaeon AArc-m2/3/4]
MPSDETDDGLWYPSVDDILLIHDDIITEDDDATPGVRDANRIEFAIEYIEDGHFGKVPTTIHEKAFHLMRLLASNHWFADGDKRTALNSIELFYLINGYELDYGEDIRSMLKLFSVRESLIDRTVGPAYLDDQTTPLEIDDDTDPLALLVVTATAAFADSLDIDLDKYLPEAEQGFSRREWGLTTDSDGTVNTDDDKDGSTNGG